VEHSRTEKAWFAPLVVYRPFTKPAYGTLMAVDHNTKVYLLWTGLLVLGLSIVQAAQKLFA
jgi:hypothetical protein